MQKRCLSSWLPATFPIGLAIAIIGLPPRTALPVLATVKLPESASALRPNQIANASKAEADRLMQQGEALSSAGKPEAALDSFNKALPLYQQLSDRIGQIDTLNGIGTTYYKLGNFRKAVEIHQQAVSLAKEPDTQDRWGGRQRGDRQGQAAGFYGQGNAYKALGQQARAIELYKDLFAVAGRMGDRKWEAKALNGLQIAYRVTQQYKELIEWYRQRVTTAREIKSPPDEASSLHNLGLAQFSDGQLEAAVQSQQQALEIARQINDLKLQVNILNGLGKAYLELKQYQPAVQAFQEALEIARKLPEKSDEEIYSLSNLGTAYAALEQYAQSSQSYQKVLELARQQQDRAWEAATLTQLGSALGQAGQLTTAETTLLDAIKLLESLRSDLDDNDKISIFETQLSAYNALQKILVAQKKVSQALEVAERGRARAFISLLASKLSEQDRPPKIEEIKSVARQQNATLVEYSIIKDQGKDSRLFVWVISPQGNIQFQEVDLKTELGTNELSEFVLSSRQQIGVRSRGFFREDTTQVVAPQTSTGSRNNERLQQLHRLLIQPIAELLPTDPKARIIFIPQGSLFMVPFVALQDSAGKFLIEKHTIMTAPAIQVLNLARLQQQRIRQAGAQEVMVVGNPDMPSVRAIPGEPKQKLSSLPGSEKEAKEIAQFLKTDPLLGKAATKKKVTELIRQEKSGFKIIHLATHGLLDDFRGVGKPGAIALAPTGPDEQNDGLLTSSEIVDNLRLNAEMVVLSACDTGLGRITGDGVIGLARSLLTAGAASVVVSLWKVPDDPTAFLMIEFYSALAKNQDKAQALRQAMLETMKKYPDPTSWAAFTLIGESQ